MVNTLCCLSLSPGLRASSNHAIRASSVLHSKRSTRSALLSVGAGEKHGEFSQAPRTQEASFPACHRCQGMREGKRASLALTSALLYSQQRGRDHSPVLAHLQPPHKGPGLLLSMPGTGFVLLSAKEGERQGQLICSHGPTPSECTCHRC